jgi:hypothetical protein
VWISQAEAVRDRVSLQLVTLLLNYASLRHKKHSHHSAILPFKCTTEIKKNKRKDRINNPKKLREKKDKKEGGKR